MMTDQVMLNAQDGKSCETCGISLGYNGAEKQCYQIKGYSISRCKNCGLMWTVIADEMNLQTIYTEDYFQGGVSDGYFDYLGSEKLLIREFQDRLKLVLAYQKSGRLLEIGCATGGFLEQARKYFTVQGIDVSEFAIGEARKKGLDVECAALESSRLVSPHYEVIVMFDAIEHLPNPAATLAKAYSLLSNGGYLLLTTGDTGSLMARILGSRWRLMTPPQHLWFFGRDNIDILLTRLGFVVQSVTHQWRNVPLSLIWYQLFRGKIRPLPEFLGRIVLPVNLFDTMTVVARKPV